MPGGFAESLIAMAQAKQQERAKKAKAEEDAPSKKQARARRRSSNAGGSTTRRLSNGSWNSQSLSHVYIKDDAYCYLPAKILATGNNQDEVLVEITLPPNWHDTTVLSRSSDILELEDVLLDTPDNVSTRSSNNVPTMTRTVSLSDYPKQELPLQNTAEQQLSNYYSHGTAGKRDMADLPFLHEAAILYNLKERHYNHHPYTRVGDIVVAMNPFQWMDHLYSSETREFYAKTLLWEAKLNVEEDDDDDDDDLNDDQADDPSQSCIHTFGKLYDKLGFDPHVYETSCMAYRNLATTQTNQTILVSGESGAGKTETVKIVMSHLATLEQSRPGGPVYTSHDNTLSAVETVKRVLESSPVFEAFGNAKTLRNDNSSRFGKFTQLQFDVESMEHAQQDNRLIPSCSLAGSFCVTYLLEKSRVVSHSKGERTYHIFYQLLEAPAQFKQTVWEDLVDATTDDFNYLGATDTHAIDGVSDKDQWPRTLNALKVFDVKGESLTTLLRALCIVLQLGNLTFDRDPTSADHEEGGTVISSPDELDKLSELMGIDSKVLESEMTLRLIKTGYDEVHVQLRPSVAKESCDALAKEIYARVFDYLVRKVNAYTRAEAHFDPKHSDTFGMISLLDIFGFERFKVNRFEQLCINYCNEALQHKYVLDNFRKVQEEYEAEGIEIFDFSVVDNSPVLNLLQGRLGLIMSLNEECVRPNGNDESYVYKIKTLHKDHVRLIDEKLHRRTEFGVKHFAGPVTYDSTKFVERNTDKLPDGLMYCAARSTNSLIREEFETLVKSHEENETSGVRRKKATNRTVLEKFRSHLRDLMASMEDTETRYIRCIKPNETMTPRMTQHDTTMRQLECAGLVTAIAISRESFPNRLGYEPIIERFGCLMSQSDAKKMSSMVKKLAVDYMLKQLLASMAEKQRNGTLVMPFQCGNTRVYFRAGALEHLETKRLGYYTKRVVTIQRCVRKIQGQAAYARTRESIIKAQTAVRAMLAYKQLQRQKSAAVMLQCWARMLQAASMLIRLKCNHAATVIQSSWRATSRLGQMHKYRKAVVVIQKAVRNRKNKTSFTAKLARTVEMARMDHRVKGLQRKVSGRGSFLPQSTTGRKVDASLLEEIETMFEYLRKEINVLRGQNADLKAELMEAENDKRDILAHAQGSEAAASSSRLQVAQLTKNVAELNKQILEHKHESSKLRKELKNAHSHTDEELKAAQVKYERAVKERDREVAALQLSIRHGRSTFDRDKKTLREEMADKEEAHTREILKLKDELRRTQDSHHDYLAKLMDVLETTHIAREKETARISAELNAVKEEKDSEIRSLQHEVQRLRSMQHLENGGYSPGHPPPSSTLRPAEASMIRNTAEKSSAARQQRAKKFQEVSQKLESMVVPPESSPSSKQGRRRGLGRKSSNDGLSSEDTQKVRKLISFLGDLYALEESSQENMDQDLVAKVNLVAPVDGVSGLQARLDAMERENRRLIEQVEQLAHCQRCEARDRRQSRQVPPSRGSSYRSEYSGTSSR